MCSAEPFEEMLAAVAEPQLAGAVDEGLRQLGDEDLAAVCVSGDPGGEEDRPSEVAVLLRDHVARVQADPNTNIRQPGLARPEILLNRNGAADGPPRARES